MTPRAAMFTLILAVGLAGCSLLGHHGETPQQKFLGALNRGNAAEASQIWLTMTPDDRDKFRRGEGISPTVPPEDVAKMLSQQQLDGGQGQITIGPNGAGSLLNLPSVAAPPGSPPLASPAAH